ncbi:bacillithiol biosynthesis deacetylase BshB1 [Alkalihalobacillus sp. MEB130]|uniref:bacillithiol biosynthesis deacetylase BshB1 n=1 Tax=Alkalihalobacillus sp. MEB130 TaxID=2976704 RepID=UPI0028DEDEBC|nr:bacillithiol biosynthesis deacetylase BshB1 [Alkalihalobacillus sp. MEB130]MDT8859986.1 bacillithiol biosynthesis deacetylase BshB1 [Alkalihalobacillus sp. MEB130]
MTKLDILAFGAHPDDVEIGMGATLAKYAKAGYHVGICDLTKAEYSSNGTVEQRQEEARHAGEIVGLATRIQLTLPDRGLKHISAEQLAEVVSVIRKYKPSILFTPYQVDRHPDHSACTEIIKEAYFNAGIKRYECADQLEAFRPEELFYYFINGYEHPDFVVDVSDFYDIKIKALQAYESQFLKTSHSIETPLTNGYINVVEARERLFGKEVGVTYAEGFKTTKPIVMTNLLDGKESHL